MSEFEMQGLSNIVWAFATLGVQHAPFIKAIAGASIVKCQQFRPQELSNSAWAFALLGFVDAPLRASISQASILRLSEFKSQDLANTAWSCATMKVIDIPLMTAISSSSMIKMASFDAKELSSHEAFDFAFSLLSLSWSFAFVMQECKDSFAECLYGSAKTFLERLLLIGQELDYRLAEGDSHVLSDASLSWVCKVAPGAQGGFASISHVGRVSSIQKGLQEQALEN